MVNKETDEQIGIGVRSKLTILDKTCVDKPKIILSAILQQDKPAINNEILVKNERENG